MISTIEHLAKAGFALHWLHPKSKRPIGNDWAAKPVASLQDLKRSYRDGNNVGVRLGKWSVVGDLFLHIIDVDIRKAELADVARAVLADLLPGLDQSTFPTVISGSGGASRHHYFLTDRAFSPKKFAHSEGFEMVWDEAKGRDVKKWDWELHLLGTGAQAAIPPSIHPDTGRPYRWLTTFDFDLVDMGLGPVIDSDAVALMTMEREVDEADINPERQKPLGLAEDDILAVLADLPKEDWVEDRDGWFRVGMALHHETGGSDEGFEMWCEFSKDSEKFDEKDQKRVWKSFKNNAQLPFRMASLVAVAKDVRLEREFEDMGDDDLSDFEEEFEDFGDEEDDMFDDLLGSGTPKKSEKLSKAAIALKKEEVETALGKPINPKIVRLNKRHAIARVSSKTVVLDFQDDGSVTYGSVNDLHQFYENDRVPNKEVTEPVSKKWMRDKHRRTYPKGIVFAPNRVVEGAYNHWQGFSVEPDSKKSCKRFLDHLFEVICNKDVKLYEYSLDYFAHLVQFPEDKPGVAFVVKGKKGAGKDTIAEYFARIIKNHYVTIANKDQLLGKFNQHQEKCLLLHVQEGFWAGDKRDEGALKYLITSENVMIEPKGMNAFPIRSVLRIFISSNEKWVVPATEDERRFFVLNVSNRRLGDHKYFDLLRKEMKGDGPAALLAMLQARDISGFQIRKVPSTQGLAEQKVEGLKNVERWWYGVLEHGSIEGLGQNHKGEVSNNKWLRGAATIEKNDFRDLYSRWLRTRWFDGEEITEIEFNKRLRVMVPNVSVSRPRQQGSRLNMYVIPELQTCRTCFEQYIGSELNWPDDEITYGDQDDSEDDDL